jgi:Ca2+-transporting ATPase
MKVTQIGMNTRLGKIAATLTTVKADKTPLQIKLDSLGKIISVIAILFAALIIPVSLSHGAALIPTILVAVSVAIAAIPEGLPAVVTIALAIGTSRMAKKNAIVRKMPVVETLGAVQVVLIDKTGTLTKNQMRVKTHWLSKENLLPQLLKAALLGNTASIVKKADSGKIDVLGDQTDGALLLWATEQGYDIQKLHQSGKLLEEFTFDSETSTITNVWEENGKKHVFVRGAPEMLLGKTITTKEEKEAILHHIETFAKQGLRVIGFAQKTDENHNIHDRNHVEKHLQFLGIVGIYDAPRDEARAAVLEAKRAGIHTVMVTGDNEITALTIAREVGLIEENEDVLTGEELDAMPDEEVTKILLQTRVFARSKPEDKLRLVELFKKAGFVVGVTGDGVNDALALKRSDVGIAMGDSGTDVAKEASDIILTDDNFSTLVKAVEEGRTIYKNIQTAITYLLAGNLSEITFIFFSSLLGLATPFHPTQILWINIITDGLPALALASDGER